MSKEAKEEDCVLNTPESVFDYMNNEDNKKKMKFAKLVDVSKVSGGGCNFVYRLKFEDGTSAILKYYPPFVSSIDWVQVSQVRCNVEKQALELLAKEPCLASSRVKTPKVIYSDDQAHLIIMEDCGEQTMTLFDFFKKDNSKLTPSQMKEMISEFSSELAKFLKMMANDISIKVETHMDPFGNESAWNVCNEYYLPIYATNAKTFGLENEVAPFIKNGKPFAQPKENACFVAGDLWPNGILVDVEKRIYWLLDWELARFGTPVRDLEQLNANLWVMMQNPKLFDTEQIQYLIDRLQFEYFGDEKADWRVKCGEDAKTTFVLWITALLGFSHWEVENPREATLKAIEEVNKL